MMKLSLAPDADGYAVDSQQSTISQRLGGGGMRVRKDWVNAPLTVTCSWTCDEDEYEYLQRFHRVCSEGADAFKMDLMIDSNVLTEHECRFIPNTFKLVTVKGMVRKVQAKIEVVPLPQDLPLDEGLVTTYEAFGRDAPYCYNLLNIICNVTIPANIK